jgi:ribonuclease P/MRP protein subunit POP5
MKHLPKHLRPRWRYLAVDLETWAGADLERRAFQREAWYAAQNLLGDPGSADADLSVVRFRHGGGAGEALVRVRRGETDAARAALACVDAVDGDPVRVRVRGVSGTIRSAEEKYMRGPQEHRETRVVFRNTERRAVARGDLIDVETDEGFTGATRFDFE